MRAAEFDETRLFRSIQDSGARALLIGRRALVLLGLPVLTADYDFWIAIDDIAAFNGAAAQCDLVPTDDADHARTRGRYVLENDERVDVLVARAVPTIEGISVAFEDVWARRRAISIASGIEVQLPMIDDLILTKQFGRRPKDLEDIRMLRILKTSSHQ
jgi:zona occludens toxin (predicted ATPase)